MRFAVLALLFACSAAPDSSRPTTTPGPTPQDPSPTKPDEAGPATPAVMSPEDCQAKGGKVKHDIGDGKVACAEGERDLGRVKSGIEGGLCCAAP